MHHIAIITTSYPDGRPGTEAAGSFVEDFAVELSKSLPVSVVAASSENSVSHYTNLTIRRFSVPRLPLSLLNPHLPWQWPAVVQTLWAGRSALRTCIREDRPDHVFAMWALPSGWWAEIEAGRQGIPYSAWALGSDIWSLGRLPGVRQVLKRVLVSASYRYADGLKLCEDVERISDKACAFLPSMRRLPDLRQSGPSNRPPYKLAFLGRWHKNKGSDLLMRALQRLNDEDWERIEEVRVHGGGPLANEIHAAEKALRHADRPVSVGGYLDRNEAASLIGWADYLILPSRVESIPVVFSDALQLGTPVVATPVGDLRLLHERFEFGVLAEAASESALLDAIKRALQTSAADFADGIRRARQEFDLATTVDRFLGDIGVAKA